MQTKPFPLQNHSCLVEGNARQYHFPRGLYVIMIYVGTETDNLRKFRKVIEAFRKRIFWLRAEIRSSSKANILVPKVPKGIHWLRWDVNGQNVVERSECFWRYSLNVQIQTPFATLRGQTDRFVLVALWESAEKQFDRFSERNRIGGILCTPPPRIPS